MGVSDEFGTIARHFAPLAAGAPGAFGLKNDAAMIAPDPARGLVATLDTMVEGVHFLPDDPPDSVARKLLRVNLSDLAAMGAVPESYLLTLALDPRRDERWVAGFAEGLAADQTTYGVTMLGGDTTGTPGPTTLSLTALGRVPGDTALTRGGARPGDSVWVSGTIGDGALGLLVRQHSLTGLPEPLRAHLERRYRLPEPRTTLGPALLEIASACLDISDGLVADVGHIAETSQVAIVLDSTAIPVSEAAGEVVSDDPDLWSAVLTGGDDYELAFTAPPDAAARIQAVSAEIGVPVRQIGRVEAGQGVQVLDRAGRPLDLATRGWTHF